MDNDDTGLAAILVWFGLFSGKVTALSVGLMEMDGWEEHKNKKRAK